ncbi:MAG: 3-phosphoserine/phosphohydroxythreonine transaminase [Defluviitaleaceae bacterium]|nr:3-phosphoserine/phosphohydroxythreonine transaminase [Defluviitaleaceae bacterium]
MRVHNFSAGPGALPEPVLRKAAEQMLDYEGYGMSVMEMSHRSKMFQDIIDEAEATLRELMNVPANYKILFLQGGATQQFAMIPMNLHKTGNADYALTGVWAKNAVEQAKQYMNVSVVASSEDKNFNYIPAIDPAKLNPNADYFHYTSNNTVHGTRFTEIPKVETTLVCDMSSNILSEVYDVSKFGLIYAGAQKNMGPSGVTVVIIREDLVGTPLPFTPIMLNYEYQVKGASMHNTPPTYGIYLAMLNFRWLKELGGVPAMQKVNEEKAKLIYDCIDESKLFKGFVEKKDRSLMNVTFGTGDADLDKTFIKEAQAAGFVNLNGYKTLGGMRVSIYNAAPTEGVRLLVEFMKSFEVRNV